MKYFISDNIDGKEPMVNQMGEILFLASISDALEYIKKKCSNRIAHIFTEAKALVVTQYPEWWGSKILVPYGGDGIVENPRATSWEVKSDFGEYEFTNFKQAVFFYMTIHCSKALWEQHESGWAELLDAMSWDTPESMGLEEVKTIMKSEQDA